MKNRNVWLVTGASRGLGLEIVKTLLAQGYQVVAAARKAQSVSDALGSHENLLAVTLDVTNNEEIVLAAKQAVAKFGRIDVLVNNAGYGQLGWFEENSSEQVRKQFETNVFGAMNVTRAVLPIMRKQKNGHIFSVSSISGIRGFAGSAVYSASKFAVEGWMEGLRDEVNKFGIKTTIIEPGFFRTDFLDATSVSHGEVEIEDYKQMSEEFKKYIDDMNHKQLGDPSKMGQALITLAENDAPPVRFAAGSDAYGVVSEKIKLLQTESSDWKDLSSSTDNQCS